jgi:hypothetical protein
VAGSFCKPDGVELPGFDWVVSMLKGFSSLERVPNIVGGDLKKDVMT